MADNPNGALRNTSTPPRVYQLINYNGERQAILPIQDHRDLERCVKEMSRLSERNAELEEEMGKLKKKNEKNEEYIAKMTERQAIQLFIDLVKKRDKTIQSQKTEIENLNSAIEGLHSQLDEALPELEHWKKHCETLELENTTLHKEGVQFDEEMFWTEFALLREMGRIPTSTAQYDHTSGRLIRSASVDKIPDLKSKNLGHSNGSKLIEMTIENLSAIKYELCVSPDSSHDLK